GVYQNNATVPPTAIPMTTQGFSVGALRGTRSTGSILTLGITRDIQFGATQNYVTIGVTLTNQGATVLSGVAWLENLDPDQGQGLPGWPSLFNTINDVQANGRYVEAYATGNSFPSGLTIALGSFDARAVASVEPALNVINPFDVINSPIDP